MTYPEVNSLEESLAILKKYRNKISKDDYDNIKSVIGSHAIENEYLNEIDIEKIKASELEELKLSMQDVFYLEAIIDFEEEENE